MARTTIDRRENGRYRARYVGPDRRWRSRTFDRRVDAQRWLTSQLSKVDLGEWVDPQAGRVPFERVAERWMAGRGALRLSTRTRDLSYLRSLVLPRFGAQPIGKMQPSDIDGWIADLMADGYAPRTIQRAWQIVLGVCRLAVRDRMILISPAREVTLPKVVRVEPVVFTVEEVMRLADAIDPRYRALGADRSLRRASHRRARRTPTR